MPELEASVIGEALPLRWLAFLGTCVSGIEAHVDRTPVFDPPSTCRIMR